MAFFHKIVEEDDDENNAEQFGQDYEDGVECATDILKIHGMELILQDYKCFDFGLRYFYFIYFQLTKLKMMTRRNLGMKNKKNHLLFVLH